MISNSHPPFSAGEDLKSQSPAPAPDRAEWRRRARVLTALGAAPDPQGGASRPTNSGRARANAPLAFERGEGAAVHGSLQKFGDQSALQGAVMLRGSQEPLGGIGLFHSPLPQVLGHHSRAYRQQYSSVRYLFNVHSLRLPEAAPSLRSFPR